MKEQFLDECKDRIFNALFDLQGEEMENSYDLGDRISELIGDDVIYYSEGEEAYRLYPDEFQDSWERVKELVLDTNPFEDSFKLDVWRAMLADACTFIVSEVVPESNHSFELDERMLLATSKQLDSFCEYPFSSEGYRNGVYPYVPEERSFYQEAKDLIELKEKQSKAKGIKI